MSFQPKKLLKTAIFLAVLAYTLPCAAQDASFSQFRKMPERWNAALVGNAQQGEITLIFRDQWSGLPNSWANYAASWTQFFDPINSAFGINVHGDQQAGGLLNTYSVNLYYAYALQLSRNMSLRAGFELGLHQRRLAWEELRFFDQIDPIFGFSDPSGVPNPTAETPPGSNQINWIDAGFGVVLFSQKWYLGASAAHLNQPNLAFYDAASDELPIRWSAQAGAELPFGSKRDPHYWSPYATYTIQGPFQTLLSGMDFKISALILGAAFRHAMENPDALILTAGFELERFEMSYSYDVPVGGLQFEGGGAHEIALQLRLPSAGGKGASSKAADNLRCPGF